MPTNKDIIEKSGGWKSTYVYYVMITSGQKINTDWSLTQEGNA